MERFNNILYDFIATEKWTFAKTVPDWPHEYIVKERVDEHLFVETVLHIRKYGYEGRFYSKKIIYFDQDGYTYWTMGAPIEETIIINRTPFKKREITCSKKIAYGIIPTFEF